MAQRFPTDFDGIVRFVPVINWTGLQSAGNRSGIIQRNGGWISAGKIATLHKAVIAAYDPSDGLNDGGISAYEKCIGVFSLNTLRCVNGTDAGDLCLSDAQVLAIETLRRPFEFGFAVATASPPTPVGTTVEKTSPAG